MPFVESPGTRLYYEETGPGDPIVLLHEFAADYRTWEAQVRRQVIVVTGGGSGIGAAMRRRLTREGARGCRA